MLRPRLPAQLALAFALTSAGFDWPSRTPRLLAELAASDDTAERCDLLRLLAQAEGAAAEDALLAAAQDASPELRVEAVRALGRRKSSDTSRAALRLALTDAEPAVRAQAAAALGQLRDATSAALLTRLLGDSDTAVRVGAASSLGKLREPTAQVALATALDDAALEVRVAAARALGEIGDPAAFGALLGKLRDPAPELRVAIVEALPRLDRERALTQLAQALDDAHEGVVLAAARGIATLPVPPPALLERLAPLAHHPSSRVAAAARLLATRAESSAPSPAPASWLGLLEQTASSDAARDRMLIDELERALPPGEHLAVDPLRVWLDRAAPLHRPRIARLILRARPTSAGALRTLLADPQPEVRWAIAGALGHTGQAEASSWLMPLLTDEHRAVRMEAARSIARLADRSGLAALEGRLTEPGTAREAVLLAFVGALERLAPNSGGQERARLAGMLEGLARVREPDLAARALRGLGLLATGSSWPLLKDLAEAGPASVRVAALRASTGFKRDEARALRANAAADPDPRIAATAQLARWLAGDAPDLLELAKQLHARPWPLGPVASFVLASGPDAARAALCPALLSPEPVTRANAVTGLTRAPSQPCAQGATGALPRPNWVAAALDRARDLAASARSCTGGSFQALILDDGRVLISVCDAAGDPTWPELRHATAENPWPRPYGWE